MNIRKISKSIQNASEVRIKKSIFAPNMKKMQKMMIRKKLLTAIHTVGLLCPFMGILRSKSLVFNPDPVNASSIIFSNFLYLFVNRSSAMTANILLSINSKFLSTCTEWAFQCAKGSIKTALI